MRYEEIRWKLKICLQSRVKNMVERRWMKGMKIGLKDKFQIKPWQNVARK